MENTESKEAIPVSMRTWLNNHILRSPITRGDVIFGAIGVFLLAITIAYVLE